MLPLPTPWLMPLVVLVLTWTMNAFNFMDGSDGMAGMQALVSGLMLAFLFHEANAEGLALVSLGISAAAGGFLPWNWPPARCFMGDAGSVPLGWLLGGLAVIGLAEGSLTLPAAILVLAVFHVDAGLTLVRRVWRGERWYTAHRTHVYQMLMAQGRNHGQVLLAYAALNVFIVAPAVVVVALKPQWGWAAAFITFMSLAIAWCVVSLKLGERP
jgi:Fuc2NAc and GlcNAc transferase